jgi:hypothetical protein
MLEKYTWRKTKHIHKMKPIFSSERILRKDYYRKGSVGEAKSLVVGSNVT